MKSVSKQHFFFFLFVQRVVAQLPSNVNFYQQEFVCSILETRLIVVNESIAIAVNVTLRRFIDDVNNMQTDGQSDASVCLSRASARLMRMPAGACISVNKHCWQYNNATIRYTKNRSNYAVLACGSTVLEYMILCKDKLVQIYSRIFHFVLEDVSLLRFQLLQKPLFLSLSDDFYALPCS